MSRPKHEAQAYTDLADKGYGPSDIARQLGDVSEASVRRGLERAQRAGWRPPRVESPRIEIEQPYRYNLERGGIAMTADFHFPLARYDLVERFLQESEREGLKTLGVAGDLFHADHVSRFDYKQASAGIVDEQRTGTAFIDAAAEIYDEIIISWGNHDARYQKSLHYGLDFVRSMKMMLHEAKPESLAKIRWTNLDHFYVEKFPGAQGEDLWYACHPKSYSSVPLTQSRRIASKMLCNVITAHSHHHSVGWDVSGRFVCAEIGGFFDRTVTEYLQRSTQFPNWQNGYGIIRPDAALEMRSERWMLS